MHDGLGDWDVAVYTNTGRFVVFMWSNDQFCLLASSSKDCLIQASGDDAP